MGRRKMERKTKREHRQDSQATWLDDSTDGNPVAIEGYGRIKLRHDESWKRRKFKPDRDYNAWGEEA